MKVDISNVLVVSEGGASVVLVGVLGVNIEGKDEVDSVNVTVGW